MLPAASPATAAAGGDPVAARAAAERLAGVDVDLRGPDAADAVVDLVGHLHAALTRVAAAGGR